ncbi:MAG: GDSL-type esterase/lipase family protein [Luteolibacter sp.]|uniref:GDSL-type esterase/lipase family protein n=1 Tax=Luteolibacter sp. TaxID=1962973 RepID=UPI0032636310
MKSIFLRSLLILSLGVPCVLALEPTPRPNPARMVGEITAFAKQVPEKGGIVFTGSSSIRLWTHLKEDFPGLPVVNRGFGGSVANDLVVYFETLVTRHEPKVLVTYTGSNDIDEKLTVDDAFSDYTKFLNMAHDRFPKIRVILTSVKVAPRRAIEIPQVNDLNRRLESWCKDKGWLRYVDSTSYLVDSQDQPIASYFRDDHLHLNDSGYAKWQSILDPVLREEWAKVN